MGGIAIVAEYKKAKNFFIISFITVKIFNTPPVYITQKTSANKRVKYNTQIYGENMKELITVWPIIKPEVNVMRNVTGQS